MLRRQMDLSEPQMGELIQYQKNRCLILSVGRKVSLVMAFREAGWIVHGKDDDRTAVGLKFCHEEFTGSLDDYDLIVPTRDAELAGFAGFPGVASLKTIQTCIDKFEFSKWCKQNGFLSPEVRFVKPRISKSGKETECVWQELVEGDEYSIDLFADFDGNVISVVPRRRERIIAGESSVSVTVNMPSMLEEAVRLSKALSLRGHNVLQCFSTGKIQTWTDINCRFGGGSIIGIKAGCKSPEWLLRLVNGQKVEPCIGEYQVGLTGKSFTEWTFE